MLHAAKCCTPGLTSRFQRGFRKVNRLGASGVLPPSATNGATGPARIAGKEINVANAKANKRPAGVEGAQTLGQNLYLKEDEGVMWIGFDAGEIIGQSKTRVDAEGKSKGGNPMVATSRGFLSVTDTSGNVARVSINVMRDAS